MEAQIRVPQQRSAAGYSDVEVGGRRETWMQLLAQGPLRTEDVTISLLGMMRQPTEKKTQRRGGALPSLPKKEPRDLEPLVLETPAEDKKLMLEISGDSKTIEDWINAMRC